MFGKNATAVTLCPSRGMRWEEQDAAVLSAGLGKSQPFLQALPPTFLLYGVPIALCSGNYLVGRYSESETANILFLIYSHPPILDLVIGLACHNYHCAVCLMEIVFFHHFFIFINWIFFLYERSALLPPFIHSFIPLWTLEYSGKRGFSHPTVLFPFPHFYPILTQEGNFHMSKALLPRVGHLTLV